MSHKRHVTLLTGWAQVFITIAFVMGYFHILLLFISGRSAVPEDSRDMVNALLGALTGSVVTILAFWFSRHREKEDNDAHTQDFIRRYIESVVAGNQGGVAGAGGRERVDARPIGGEGIGEGGMGEARGEGAGGEDRALRGRADEVPAAGRGGPEESAGPRG